MDSPSPAPARPLAGRATPAASTSCQRGSRPRAASVTARASSGGSPSPSSATRTVTWSWPAAWAVTTTRVCGGLWVRALPSRFTKTCSSRSWSAQIAGSPGAALTSTSEAASGGSTAMAASSTSGMSHQSPCSRNTPDSIAEKSSRSLTRRPSRADSAAMRDRNRCSEAASQVTSCCSRRGRVAGDRGQRRPQLVAEPAQERLLQLARVPQRHRLLVRDQRPLPLERHPQRVGRVLEQVGRLVPALPVRPRRQQHGPPGRGGERHPLVPARPGDAGGHAVRPAAVERGPGRRDRRRRNVGVVAVPGQLPAPPRSRRAPSPSRRRPRSPAPPRRRRGCAAAPAARPTGRPRPAPRPPASAGSP